MRISRRTAIRKRGGLEAVSWAATVEVAKVDADRRLVFGYASTVTDAAGNLVSDHQGDRIPVETIEGAAYDYVSDSGALGDMHERIGVGELVESIVLTPEKRAALGMPDGPVRWWLGFRVLDQDTLDRLDAGELRDFSIGGTGDRIPNPDGTADLVNLRIREVSLVDTGAGLGANVALRKAREEDQSMPKWIANILQHLEANPETKPKAAEIRKALKSKVRKDMTVEEALALLPDDARAIVMSAMEALAAQRPPEADPAAAAGDAATAPMPPMAPMPPTPDPTAKMGPPAPELTKRLEDAEARAKAAEARQAEVAKRLEAIEEERRMDRARELVRKDFARLPAGEGGEELLAKLVTMADRVAKSNSADGEVLQEVLVILKRLNAALGEASLFQALGTGAEGLPIDADDGGAVIMAAARELAAKDGIPVAKAVAKVAKDPKYREAYARDVAKRRSRS